MGKRKEHWSVRKKNKKLRKEQQKMESLNEDEKVMEQCEKSNFTTVDKSDSFDRRKFFPNARHPGSYAVKYFEDKEKKNITESNSNPKEVGIKRKYALLIGYIGSNYTGLQMNPGVSTVEAEVERALFEVGCIAESNYGYLQKIGWTRSGRTDKGVHACGQILSAKLAVGDSIPEFLTKANDHLPSDIRILDCIRVTKNFHAKNGCDKRTYEYLAPTFLFASNEQPFDVNNRINESQLEKIRTVLQKYTGSHNFNNFTSKLLATDPKCRRYIISFEASEPFVADGIEWIKLTVLGQSFLLHQIRKMIGLAIDIVRGSVGIDILDKAFHTMKMAIPKAPGIGLYLSKAHFDVYNEKNADEKDSLDFDNDDQIKTIESFKKDVILKHIIELERKTSPFADWIKALVKFPFSYQQYPEDEWKTNLENHAREIEVKKNSHITDAEDMSTKIPNSDDISS